jgi:hypothetical protein
LRDVIADDGAGHLRPDDQVRVPIVKAFNEPTIGHVAARGIALNGLGHKVAASIDLHRLAAHDLQMLELGRALVGAREAAPDSRLAIGALDP